MKYTSKTILTAFLAAQTHIVDAIPCKALVMSGGSNRGAWEAGVIWGLAHYGNPSDYYWDVVSGVSAGSINTAGTAGFKPEEVIEMTEFLSDQWLNITNSQVWKPRTSIRSILHEKSLLDDSPALETLREIMSVRQEFGRRVTVSAVDIQSGDFAEFNQNNTSYSDFAQAALSSSSIPGVFPPQFFHGDACIDGGTAWNVNIDSALKQCWDMGATNEEITLDVVVVGYDLVTTGTADEVTLQNFITAHDIHKYYGMMNNIDEEIKAGVGINFRYYFQEHGLNCPGNSLNFNGDVTWCLQLAGRKNAQDALLMGQEFIGSSLKEWLNDKSLQKANPYVYDYIKAKFVAKNSK